MKKFNFKSLLAMILALVLALLAFAGCSTNNDDDKNEPTETPSPTEDILGFEIAIKNYVDFANGNSSVFENLAPQIYWDYIEGKNGFDLDNYIKKELPDAHSEFIQQYKDGFGNNYKMTYRILNEKKLSDNEFNEIKERLDEKYNTPKECVADAYELEVEFKISGDKETNAFSGKLYPIKIDGKWYIYDYEFIVEDFIY